MNTDQLQYAMATSVYLILWQHLLKKLEFIFCYLRHFATLQTPASEVTKAGRERRERCGGRHREDGDGGCVLKNKEEAQPAR